MRPPRRVIGPRYSPETLQIREFLARTRLAYEWLDPDADPLVESLLEQFQIEPTDLPVVISSGEVLRRTSPGAVSEYLGLTVANVPKRCVDLVIVGGGPAGLAAAVYGASEGLRTICVDMVAPGGQAGTSSRIENYFGFPTGISGSELTKRGLGASREIRCLPDRSLHCGGPARAGGPFRHRVVRRLGALWPGLSSRPAVRRHRRLEVNRLSEFESSGVYYAATDLRRVSVLATPSSWSEGATLRDRRQCSWPNRGAR